MKTLHLEPDQPERVRLVVEEIERLLDQGKAITVTVAEEHAFLSPRQATDRLGLSRKHIVRLVAAGELEMRKQPEASYWRIPLASVLSLEERRDLAGERADAFSRSLDAQHAPLE